jgi:GcrA cell cycle regulator
MTPWTEKEDAILIDCIKKGLSFYQASLTLDRTRNSCIGRAHRLGIGEGWQGHLERLSAAKSTRPKIDKPPRAKLPVRKEKPVKAEARFAPPQTKPVEPLPAAFVRREDGQGVPLLDLKHDQCRWPLCEFHEVATHFCGAKADEGHSWCGAHRQLAYAPKQPARVNSLPSYGSIPNRKQQETDPGELRL